jgi:hypothetical protein
MELSATRDLKGRARDKVYVDNVSWDHSYAIGGGAATNYAVVIRVRDGRGCQATLSQTVAAVSGNNWDPAQLSAGTILTDSNIRLQRVFPAVGGVSGSSRSARALTGNAYVSAGVTSQFNSGAIVAVGVGDGSLVASENTSIDLDYIGKGPFGVSVYLPNGSVWWASNSRGFITGGPALGSTFSSNVEIAVRTASRRVWVRYSGSDWFGGGDPAADTSPSYTLPGTQPIFLFASINRTNVTALNQRFADIHPTAAQTTGVVPAGFTAANWA